MVVVQIMKAGLLVIVLEQGIQVSIALPIMTIAIRILVKMMVFVGIYREMIMSVFVKRVLKEKDVI